MFLKANFQERERDRETSVFVPYNLFMGHSIVCMADSFSVIVLIEQDARPLFDAKIR